MATSLTSRKTRWTLGLLCSLYYLHSKVEQMGPCILFLTTHTSFALGISSSWEPGPQQCGGPQNNRWILTKIFTKYVILLLLLEKYIRHFRTSRKARYFKKPHSTVNYMYSREDEDPHTKQWLSFKKRRLQLTSRAQELFFLTVFCSTSADALDTRGRVAPAVTPKSCLTTPKSHFQKTFFF
jgi:hypothetical protein